MIYEIPYQVLFSSFIPVHQKALIFSRARITRSHGCYKCYKNVFKNIQLYVISNQIYGKD